MATDDTRAGLREQIVLLLGNALYSGKSIAQISKITKKQLEPFEVATDQILQLFDRYSSERAISELKQIEPPEQYEEYAKLMGQNSCTICGFDAVKFRKYIQERIAALTPKAKGETE